MSNFAAITGIQTGLGQDGPGSVPFRLEIRDMQRNYPDQWNIYLLGLMKLQDVNYLKQTEKLSYYQISGIHGRPYIAWDGVKTTESGNSATSVGYCTHASVYFPTWHRAYLALFEQALYNAVQAAVKEFPEGPLKIRYTAAALVFRIPYWDWAIKPTVGENTFPNALGGFDGKDWKNDTISVITPQFPDGTTVKNPLYSYIFNPAPGGDFANIRPWATYKSTVRHTSSNSPDAKSRNLDIVNQINNNQETIRESLYTLLIEYEKYLDFSNTEFHSGDPNRYDSIENIHNMIHVFVGGQGNMSITIELVTLTLNALTSADSLTYQPDFAAFDPVFWLHHAMVDRTLAIWQALHPDSFFESTAESGDTALLPFRRKSGKFHSSNTVRNPKDFGSTYPELADWTFTTMEAFNLNLRNVLFNLYASDANAQSDESNGIDQNSISIAGFDGPAQSIKSKAISTDSTASQDSFRRWTVNIRVKKYALGGSFYVHIFLGDFDSEPQNWCYERNLVGSYAVFANDPDTTQCPRCVGDHNRDLLVTGTVPLLNALKVAVQNGLIANLEPESVVPYLKRNLHWRISKLDNTPVDRSAEELSSLKVFVISTMVRSPDDPMGLPIQNPAEVHYDITEDRPAGLQRGDEV